MAKIEVGAHTVYYHGTKIPAFAALFASQTFVNEDFETIVAGDPSRLANFYRKVPVTYDDNTGEVTIPAFDGANKVDSTVLPENGTVLSTYTLGLYTSGGALVTTLFSNLRVSSLPSPTIWPNVSLYSNAYLQPARHDYYDTEQIGRLLSSYMLFDLDLSVIGGLTPSDDDVLQRKGGSWANRSPLQLKTDLRVGFYSLSDYASLSDALTAVGSSAGILKIDRDLNISSAAVFPATLLLEHVPGYVITKSGSGSINFQGVGLLDPVSPHSLFSGFAVGDILWSGATWPARISSALWADSLTSTQLKNAIGAFASKEVLIYGYPGTISSQVNITSKKTVHLTRGTYTGSGAICQFGMYDNTKLCGDGEGQTFIAESPTSVEILRAENVFGGGFDGRNENIEVCDLSIVGNPATPYNSAGSAIYLGNTYNGHIRRMSFKNTHGFAAYVGAFGTSGNTADLCSISDIVTDGLGTQQIGFIAGRNCAIRNIQVWNPQPDPMCPLGVVIDIEPNAAADIAEGLVIENIWMDGRNALVNWSGVIVQAANANSGIKTGRVSNITIIGSEANSETGHLIVGVSLDGCEGFQVNDIYVRGSQQAGFGLTKCRGIYGDNITIENAGGGGSAAMGASTTAESFLRNCRIYNRPGFASSTEFAEGETTVIGNVVGSVFTVTNGERLYSFMAGLTVTIAGVDYTLVSCNQGTITLSAPPGDGVGVVMVTKFLNNRYSNIYPDNYTLETNSRSQIDRYAFGCRNIVYAPPTITADIGELNVRRICDRLDISTNASHSIGALFFNSIGPIDGQKVEIYNAGANNLIIKHLDAGSFPIYQFSIAGGADITLVPGDRVYAEYNGTAQRWLTRRVGNVTLTSTQTLTNKTLTAPVINSPTGIVKGDVGLANVDNTSDVNKPVSTAQQTALNLKADASAVATALALKADLAGATFGGAVSVASRFRLTTSTVLAAGATPSLNASLGNVFTLTPGEDENISITNQAAGQIITLIILTSGTTSRTITFGSGFKPNGTLATGIVSGKYFIVRFFSDGTNAYEISRTTAL